MKVHKEDFTWAWKKALIDCVNESNTIRFDKLGAIDFINEHITFEDIVNVNKSLLLEIENEVPYPFQIKTLESGLRAVTQAIQKYTDKLKREKDEGNREKLLKTIEGLKDRKGKLYKTYTDITKLAKKQIATGAKNIEKEMGYATPTWQKVGVTGLAVAAILAAAYYAYKRWLTASARACRGKRGKERKVCELQFKITGAQQAISKLQENLPQCQYKRNRERCELKIQRQMWKWKSRLERWQKELIRLQQSTRPEPFA